MAEQKPIRRVKNKPTNAFLSIIKRHPKRSFEVLFFIIVSIAILLCLTLIFRRQGWPQNHEGLAFIMRSEIYADHFKQGDLFPIWASADANGMGTPLPLYYHKTFYYLSGALLALFGSAKLAIWLTISVFMYVGAYGMRFCAAVLSSRKSLVAMAVLLFLFSNYLFSNWLVRGAMAEFTAMMLVPWLLWWCLNVIKNQKLSFSIVPIFYLLFQSHNITALFSMVPLTLACAYFIYVKRKESVHPLIKFIAICSFALFLLILPQIVIQAIFLHDYDPSKITQMGYLASDNFRPINAYVGDGYVWLRNWQELNVSLDKFVWAVIVVGLVTYIIKFIQGKRWQSNFKKININPSVVFLIVSLMIYLVLQLPASASIYKAITLMQFLQFPWRLLSYITPLSILLCVVVIGWMTKNSKPIQYIVAIFVLVGTLLVSPLSYHYGYSFFSTNVINDNLTTREQGLGSDLLGIGEYLPKVYDSQGKELSTMETVKRYQQLVSSEVPTNGSCKVTDIKPRQRFEDMHRVFSVSCLTPNYVYLPISYNVLSKVYISSGQSKKLLPVTRAKTDPRMSVYIKSTQPQKVTVDLPKILQF